MSYQDGWAAMNLEMPKRIPHEEFDAERHWELVKAVTGIIVEPTAPRDEKVRAMQAFMKAWNYDLMLTHSAAWEIFGGVFTNMGHAVYEAGGIDYNDDLRSPFTTPEEVLAFDPWKFLPKPDKKALIRHFNEAYRSNRATFGDMVHTTGTYVTLFSGLIALFGWELLLTAGGLDPKGLGEVANRYAGWMQHYYDALAESETPIIYSHDDIVWTRGPVFHPDWYRKYIFPNYRKYYTPCRAKGKKVIFVSDGNYTTLVDDVVAVGIDGMFFEPLTDLKYIAERYGKTHVMVGNADTRILLSGTKSQIRAEVERCMSIGRHCPGYFMGVTNMIPHNTPVESALYYQKCYEELSRR